MEVKKLTLYNVGRFKELEVLLAPHGEAKSNVTVLVGNNGSGKTSILRSLATSLSWLVARIRTERGSGSQIPELVIKNGENSAAVDVDVFHHIYGVAEDGDVESDDGNYFSWRIAKTRKGRKGHFKSDYSDLTFMADHYRTRLSTDENTNLPLIAFYSVERVVIDIPLKIRGKHSFLQLDGYDNALNQGVDFRRFFEWYRKREDTENESGIGDDVLEQIKNMLGQDNDTWKKLKTLKASTRDKQLTAVRSAIYTFMPEFSNLRVRRKPRLHMSIDKNGETLDVAQLSQGEKSLMALVGDIARRLAVMNPNFDNPLKGDGIILIDEVDMHLHPEWQQLVLQNLEKTFPNIQFVVSTHSPQVLTTVKKEQIVKLENSEKVEVLGNTYGEESNYVLNHLFDVESKPPLKHTETLKKYYVLIESGLNTTIEAKSLRRKLENILGEHHSDLMAADRMIKRKELLG
ncbi:ATP-binding protein [Parashewanella spongiae]|uniref:ATP-binding protein n=1 Tax=Parashewanella spongiae TaxID=342950 RepID=A0A3A6T716_9GAMM|nr:AAA family ATPase [Parashewanella spongiae]MCL1080051.1 AAA family ATPase [Parashewanella spongiae]RJY05211.1 ATP-binding protein [Parashewanella spongiae]